MTLSSAVDAVLRSALNAAASAGRRQKKKSKKASASPPPPVGAEAPVVIGDTVPSKLESLRTGRTSASVPVLQTVPERRLQTYLHGSTGSGKSVTCMALIDADIAAGRSIVVIDNRGDLCTRILARLASQFPPEALRERLTLLDLRQRSPYQPPEGDTHCVGFNPLREAGADGYSAAFFCFDAITSQFDAGVQTAELLRNAILALSLTEEPCCLLDIESLLFDDAFRERVLRTVADKTVRRFFWRRFPALMETPQYAASLLNRLSPYTSIPALRRLLGMRTGGLSFRERLEKPGAIILCCLGADELHSGSSLVGSLILSAVAKSVMRSDRSLAKRKEGDCVFLYLDEFVHLGNSPAASQALIEIISEGRRFGLGAVLAHQSTAQLDPKLRNLLRNIVGTQMYFACGGNDADLLAGELPSDEPKAILRNRLISMPVGNALLLRRGKPLVQIHTRYEPDPDVSPEAVAALRTMSLVRWGRPKAEVDAETETGDGDGGISGTTEAAVPGASGATPSVPDGASAGHGKLEVRDVADTPPAKPRRAGRPRKGDPSS